MGEKDTKNKIHKNGLHKQNGQSVFVREFEPADEPAVQRIFYEGLMEMVPDIAFRGLRHHPESVLLYTVMTVVCFIITMSWWVIGLLPAIVLGLRYFYSRRVIHGYLRRAMSTDMGDIEGFYMNSPGSCMWVAVLEGTVVGVVAAVIQQDKSGRAVELQRMSVARSHRHCGIGKALGQKVLEFAASHGYSSVFLGTTAYTPAAHRLYRHLGFRCVGVTNGYVTPGASQSLMEWIFYRPADEPAVQQIFYEGLMEMVPDTAFRGLRHHPESVLLYAAMTVVCFIITMSWWVIGLLPAIVLGLRYFYSRRVIHGYLR